MRTLLKKVEKEFGSEVQIKNLGRSTKAVLEVKIENLIKVSAWLRMEEFFRMDFLENFSIYEIKNEIIVSYFIRSTSQGIELVIRTSLPTVAERQEIILPSLTSIWPQAEAFQAEQAALFGVCFSGKANPSRVTRNFGNFSGFPLRKEFFLGAQVEF